MFLKGHKKTWTLSSTFYRYRQTPIHPKRVKAHAISVSIRTFTLDGFFKSGEFVEQESKRTLLYVCINTFIYAIGGFYV